MKENLELLRENKASFFVHKRDPTGKPEEN